MRQDEFDLINDEYNDNLDLLEAEHFSGSKGKVRDLGGTLFEGIIDQVAVFANVESKIGNKDLITAELDGEIRNIQVDRHIWKNGQRFAFIESKTYLDSCYLQRAIFNFLEISMQIPSEQEVKFAIFAGQNACGRKTLPYFHKFFKNFTGKDLNVFFVNAGNRTATKPIATNKFPLVQSEVQKFYDFLAA